MSILVGKVSAQGKLLPPTGFGSVQAIRLSNYTAFPVTVNNIGGVGQSSQLLMPNQQMVYPTNNVSTTPTLAPSGNDTLADVVANVFVEWSTEPSVDFIGVYPAQLSLPANVVAEAIFTQGVPNTFLSDFLVSVDLPVAFEAGDIDVSSYASLIIVLEGSPIPTQNQVALGVQQCFFTGQAGVMDEWVLTSMTGVQCIAITPVSGKFLTLNNNGSHALNVSVYGTNRLTPTTHLLCSSGPRNLSVVAVAMAPTVITPLPAIDGLGNETQLNGAIVLNVNTSGAGSAGTLFCQYLNGSGTPETVAYVIAAAVSSIATSHPLAGCTWGYRTNSAAGTIGTVILTLLANAVS